LVDSLTSALAAYRRLSRPLATWRVLKFLLSNRDPFPLRGWLDRTRPGVIGQDFVKGRTANIMVACWNGEVLASVAVVTLRTKDDFGASAIVQLISHAEMEAVVTRLVRRLGMSGFCGIDFILEEGSDRAIMIELNPRATQLGHLRFGPAGSLVSVLLSRLRGETASAATGMRIAEHGTVAFFPQAWLADADSPLLSDAYLDIPWHEPKLMAELLRPPRDVRSPLARLTGVVMGRPDPGRVLAKAFANRFAPQSAHEPFGGRAASPARTPSKTGSSTGVLISAPAAAAFPTDNAPPTKG
jgi:hypothetical protein